MIAFDCHAHVYERIKPAGRVRYLPAHAAPRADWLGRLRAHGLGGGVIVQVSFLGSDNSQLLEALSTLDHDRFAGVATVGPDATGPQLRRLGEGGVRGVRWNLVAGAEIPDPSAPETRRFLGRLRDQGMHLEVQLESPRLAPVLARLCAAAGTLVIDHMGLPERRDPEDEPWLVALAAMKDRRAVHVKLSAPYRSGVDPLPPRDPAMPAALARSARLGQRLAAYATRGGMQPSTGCEPKSRG